MEVAAVSWAVAQGGVHLAQQQHDGQLYEIRPIKARLLCCVYIYLNGHTIGGAVSVLQLPIMKQAMTAL